MVIDGKKMCSRCKKFKSIKSFWKSSSKSKDGFQCYCKMCYKEYRKSRTNHQERFEMWLEKSGYVGNEDIDIDTLREVFEAMDDEDK